jgi:hypothetical protein
MPPSNTTSGTATLITSFPFDFTQTDINAGGVNYTVWYKFVAPENYNMMGASAWSGHVDESGQYEPLIEILDTNLNSVHGIVARSRPIQFPVTSGQTYYLKITSNLNNAVTTNQVRVQCYLGPTMPIRRGDIVVHDDTTPLAVAVLSSTNSYEVKNFIPNKPGGETASILPNGTIILEDEVDYDFMLYDKDFNSLLGVNLQSFGVDARYVQRNPDGSLFWSLYTYGTAPVITEIRWIRGDGVLGPVITVPSAPVYPTMSAADQGGHVIYYMSGTSAVKRWNVDTNSAMTDLVPAMSGYYTSDLFVMGDGTIIVMYAPNNTNPLIVKRYNSSGTTVSTHTFPGIPGDGVAHMAHALDDPLSYWIWEQPRAASLDGVSKFHHISTSDGAILETISHMQFEGGAGEGPRVEDPDAKFGHSFSCTFFMMTQDSIGGATGNGGGGGNGGGDGDGGIVLGSGGIYQMVPNKRTDTLYTGEFKIPDPFIKTGLL